jgi:hypothetical protein
VPVGLEWRILRSFLPQDDKHVFEEKYVPVEKVLVILERSEGSISVGMQVMVAEHF